MFQEAGLNLQGVIKLYTFTVLLIHLGYCLLLCIPSPLAASGPGRGVPHPLKGPRLPASDWVSHPDLERPRASLANTSITAAAGDHRCYTGRLDRCRSTPTVAPVARLDLAYIDDHVLTRTQNVLEPNRTNYPPTSSPASTSVPRYSTHRPREAIVLIPFSNCTLAIAWPFIRDGVKAELWLTASHITPTINLPVPMSPLAIVTTTLLGAVAIYLLTRNTRSPRADHSSNMSPDTVSSLFPDRPIRPLPKRRLREKLSPEVADSIKYPPSTHDNAPLFYYPPYTLKDEGSPPRTGSTSLVEQGRRMEIGRNYTPRRNGVGLPDGDEEETSPRSTLVTRSPPEILTRPARRPSRPDQARHPNPQPPPSTTSSVDGYDSFENTNNKKKRKIPSAGDPTLNGTHALNNDIGSLAISSNTGNTPVNELHTDRSYTHTGTYPSPGTFATSNQGISGPGRGRLGRSRNGRSPLRALPDGNNTWAGRASKAAPPQWASAEHEGSGIISNAIANAERLRPQDQENVSLLQQHSSATKTTPASTQFTFTCDSQVPGTIQWPAPSGSPGTLVGNGVYHDGSSKAASRGSGSSRRKSRRRLEKDLNMAARHRRQLAADDYYHNPPRLEDIWICEFCEYERIFGEPPMALIRDYEIKDRRHRQEEADRKRLLEKAKAKSRKGRKSGKASTRGGHAANQNPAQGTTELEREREPGASPMVPDNSHSTQSEEDYADGIDDEDSGENIMHRRPPHTELTSSPATEGV
ncbi:hypothetical protein FALBO_9418 [Fusarium albosuccineum]|uniref:Uncharacterized protein n=1 Tax=Fusarium albosuccineum TaxID=1237068 RepID=A0A8H4L8V9_9HYPO|nr:hypothetical protein FALBO_9418 [Fusarium albosuccineum]